MIKKAPNTSFLVRIWWERRSNPADPPIWRGRVEHIPSGRVAHFDELAGFVDFVEGWTGHLPDQKHHAAIVEHKSELAGGGSEMKSDSPIPKCLSNTKGPKFTDPLSK